MIKLINGDCLEEMDKLIEQRIVFDAIITDPPYGTTACKWDSIIQLDEMWVRLKKLIKPSGAIVLFGTEPFSSTLRLSNIKGFKYDWIWDKVRGVGFQIAKYRPMQQHELISIFSSNGETVKYYPIMWERDSKKISKCYKKSDSSPLQYNDNKKREYTHSYPKSILTFSNASQKGKVHPTQKPVALMEYLIKTYTNENDTILDFTMGSGSTLVAAKNLNRNAYGIEKDEKYFEIAKNRIENT